MQLSRDLGIHQSSAWFLLHRIRETLKDLAPKVLGGEGCVVETDTTIVGGKIKNMHVSKRKSKGKGNTSAKMSNKTIVAGFIERGLKHVDTDSILMTDNANQYRAVGREYAAHEVVDHRIDEYVREKVWHTNTIEGAFSHFDRMVIGVIS